jgi:Polyketide cyclase / dehydrase and lipid transport
MSRRWAVAGVVEAPADRVFARVCAIGPAGSGQLAGPPHRRATTATGSDGVLRYTAPIGQPPVTTVTVEVDPAQRTLVVQGHWWYRGVHTITPHPRGSRLEYRVHNVASWGRWMVPPMRWRLPTRMRRDLDQLLRMIAEQLGCAAYRLA